jgi:hypothetical protein|tara:strand:+ start:16452 stop:16946 length:495 start_codon:yes stop_codon:yes gene_type:complete
MAYSGKYTVKNPVKYQGDPSKVIYRSLWEKYCFKWADLSPDVKGWSSEEVVIPYYYDIDKKYHRYFMDLKVTWSNGKTWLIEIKPEKETQPPKGDRRTKRYLQEGMTYVKNMNKWEAANKYALDRKWEFHIWTEKKLQEMGLMPKPLKKLKPLPKPKKKPKKKV